MEHPGMSIYLGDLSPDAYRALETLCDHDWAPIYKYMEPEWVAWLTFRLKYVPDSEEVFPKGKWATIQRLQQMVDDYAKHEAGK